MKKIKEYIDLILRFFVLEDEDDDQWLDNALIKPECNIAEKVEGNTDIVQGDEYEDYIISFIPIKGEFEEAGKRMTDLGADSESVISFIASATKFTRDDIFVPGLVSTFQHLNNPKYLLDLVIMAECYFTENKKIRVMAYEEQMISTKDVWLFIPVVCKNATSFKNENEGKQIRWIYPKSDDPNGLKIFSRSGELDLNSVVLRPRDELLMVLKLSPDLEKVLSDALG